MIRLDLGEEPTALASARDAGLRRVGALLPVSTEEERRSLARALHGYREPAHQRLHALQRGKCAWCERQVGTTSNPVEHVRPKNGADDIDAHGTKRHDPSHYWWLAWSWTNLVLSCATCNDNAHKGNWFPVEPGTTRVVAPALPVALPLDDQHFDMSTERPRFVHPRFDDPTLWLQWSPVDRSAPRARWRWTLVARDGPEGRGETTRTYLKLWELEDQVNAHLKSAVLSPEIEIQKHLGAGRLDDARETWSRMVDHVIDDPEVPFRSAAWWAADSLWPSSERQRVGFRDPAVPVIRA